MMFRVVLLILRTGREHNEVYEYGEFVTSGQRPKIQKYTVSIQVVSVTDGPQKKR